ncbi:MAG: 30S ribosomal protein S11 [Candidatus Undinarchaeales archaeon]|jgi:small subunit ribosomal protein S11|nr:30S ribosomal protein S11 [Candidatus Undinarchaeales archaeon]
MSKNIIKRAVVHIFSSFNNTIINATDITGAETIACSSGGMVVRSGREKPGPFAAMTQVRKIADDLKGKNIFDVDVQVKAPGGNRARSPGPGAQAAIRALTRSGIRVGKIKDVTPVAHGTMRKKGGRRGRRV